MAKVTYRRRNHCPRARSRCPAGATPSTTLLTLVTHSPGWCSTARLRRKPGCALRVQLQVHEHRPQEEVRSAPAGVRPRVKKQVTPCKSIGRGVENIMVKADWPKNVTFGYHPLESFRPSWVSCLDDSRILAIGFRSLFELHHSALLSGILEISFL